MIWQMREIHHRRLFVHSILGALRMIGDIKLITEMLDVIAAIDECYSFYSFTEDTSSVMVIGHKHGWDILKSQRMPFPEWVVINTCGIDSKVLLKHPINTSDCGWYGVVLVLSILRMDLIHPAV